MKKVIAAALLLLLLLLPTACGKKGSPATPGSLVPTPHVPHTSTEEQDVREEYTKKLCRYPWLDTATMHCCRLNTDGSCQWLKSSREREEIASGVWSLTRDAEGYLTLYVTDDTGEGQYVLHELEMYDSSLYGLEESGTAFIWLLVEDKKH